MVDHDSDRAATFREQLRIFHEEAERTRREFRRDIHRRLIATSADDEQTIMRCREIITDCRKALIAADELLARRH